MDIESTAFIAVTSAVLAGVVSNVLSNEINEWLPSFGEVLVKIAVSILPLQYRERYQEEWNELIGSTPGRVSKVFQAIGLIFAASRIAFESDKQRKQSHIDAFLMVRFLNFVIGTLALVYFLPAFLLIAIILIFDGEPIFVASNKIGRGGRVFKAYKFCTVRKDNEKILEGYLIKNPDEEMYFRINGKFKFDPRYTNIGRILRKSGIDELPMILNIITSDISIV